MAIVHSTLCYPEPEEPHPSSRIKRFSSIVSDLRLRHLHPCNCVCSRSACWHGDPVCSRIGETFVHVDYDNFNERTNSSGSVQRHHSRNWRRTWKISDSVSTGRPHRSWDSSGLGSGPKDSYSRQHCCDQCDCRKLRVTVRGARSTSICEHHFGRPSICAKPSARRDLCGSVHVEHVWIFTRNIYGTGRCSSSSRRTQLARQQSRSGQNTSDSESRF